MKKNLVLTGVFVLLCAAALSAQSIDAKVKEAVDDLVSRRNVVIEVSIRPVTIAGTDTPTDLSQRLYTKINLFAGNNSRKYRVVNTRGAGRPPVAVDGTEKGEITGTYTTEGDSVVVTLTLISIKYNSTIRSSVFKIPIKELEDLGIAIKPENAKNENEVREKEKIFEPLAPRTQIISPLTSLPNAAPIPTPASAKSISIEAWPNHDDQIYYKGDMLSIKLKADQDCYFSVFHIDVNNIRQRIFPNRYEKDNFLPAKTEITIPKGGSEFEIGEPYGQETIYVVVSTMPIDLPDSELAEVKATKDVIANSVADRTVKVQSPQQGLFESITGTTRFTFTTVAPSTGTETFTYRKPENMAEAVQTLKMEIVGQGGQFTGNEREGSFSGNGFKGNYRVDGNNVIVSINQQRDKNTASATRGVNNNRGYSFSFDKPGNLTQAVNMVKTGIAAKGGSFRGDEREGNFQASGIVGQYQIANRVDVTILDKPGIIPASLIEKEVKKFFGVR
ncbi:hypothetical protein AGMMS49940_17730 [Spirochaetia bacterium]|nr:hypothetical protein AGMMS49940_17730 [Spirochaetia bacterium]